jgi:hypothetical protein
MPSKFSCWIGKNAAVIILDLRVSRLRRSVERSSHRTISLSTPRRSLKERACQSSARRRGALSSTDKPLPSILLERRLSQNLRMTSLSMLNRISVADSDSASVASARTLMLVVPAAQTEIKQSELISYSYNSNAITPSDALRLSDDPY